MSGVKLVCVSTKIARMQQRLLEVTQDLHDAQYALLESYNPAQLYAFRVAARRIRSILKQTLNHRSRELRKTWGGMAAVTGSARDWDVFQVTVDKLLEPDAVDEFKRINQDRITAGRSAVIEMLESAPWRRHLEEWNRYLESSNDTAADTLSGHVPLDRVLEKARRRLARAMASNSDRDWHRFRIAVKEIRYVAEANPKAPGASIAIKTCRSFQTQLGDWHDTVVQLGLLEELPATPLHEKLTVLVQARKVEFLSQIRVKLAGASLFSVQDK